MMNPTAKAPDNSTYSGRFAARLRMLREKAGLTVDEVVAEVTKGGHKISGKSLYNWEAGTREPPFDLLPALATAYKLKTVRAMMPEK